jgi:hypothetical protein
MKVNANIIFGVVGLRLGTEDNEETHTPNI